MSAEQRDKQAETTNEEQGRTFGEDNQPTAESARKSSGMTGQPAVPVRVDEQTEEKDEQ